jgi:hypothetical protein
MSKHPPVGDFTAAVRQAYAVLREAETLEDTLYWLVSVASDGRPLPDPPEATFTEAVGYLNGELTRMRHLYNRVAPWWVCEAVPPIDPVAVSYLEAAYRQGLRLGILLVVAGGQGFKVGIPQRQAGWRARAAFALRHYTSRPGEEFVAPLRCEAKRIIAGLAKATPIPIPSLLGDASLDWLEEVLCIEAFQSLPRDWFEMSDEQRLDAIGPPEPREPRRPPGGRPREPRKESAGLRARALRTEGMDWKDITRVVNGELGTGYALATLQQYARACRAADVVVQNDT